MPTHRMYAQRSAWLLACFLLPIATAYGQQTYTIAPDESQVVYFMKHPAHDWSGVSDKARGFIRLDAEGQPAEVDLHIPVVSFDSHNRNRDSHMAETVESYIFPEVHFHCTHITLNNERSTTWTLDGELTFHGVTQPLHTVATVVRSLDQLTAQGSFETTLSAYDIDLPSMLMVKVRDWLKIEFDLVAQPEGTHSKTLP